MKWPRYIFLKLLVVEVLLIIWKGSEDELQMIYGQ
jgi:hypothetical protein